MSKISVLILIISCTQANKYDNTKSCNNLKFHAHTIFVNEKVIIKVNNNVILNKTIKSKQDGYYFEKDFCIPKITNCIVNITSLIGSKKYLDTFFIVKNINTGYHLIISMPHPINWNEYYKDGFPPKKWGYLSIDSCIRFVKLIPDSLYTKSIEM